MFARDGNLPQHRNPTNTLTHAFTLLDVPFHSGTALTPLPYPYTHTSPNWMMRKSGPGVTLNVEKARCTCGGTAFGKDVVKLAVDRTSLDEKSVVTYFCTNCERIIACYPLGLENLGAQVKSLELALARLESLVRSVRSRSGY